MENSITDKAEALELLNETIFNLYKISDELLLYDEDVFKLIIDKLNNK